MGQRAVQDMPRSLLVNRYLELTEVIFRAAPDDEWAAVLNSVELAGLTKPQLVALLYLSHGPARMSDVAAHLRMSHPSATALAGRLVHHGLVERVRDSADRRQVLCRLTPLARTRIRALRAREKERFTGIAGRLSLDDLRTVVRAMEILASATAED